MSWTGKPEKCKGCPLWAAPGPVVRDGETVRGEGPLDARVVLVGESPSIEEIRRGSVFVGPAGSVLNLALKGAGMERRALYITNVVKCMTGRTPTRHEVDECTRRWLWDELATVKPTTIIALGQTAWSVFSEDPRGIEAWRGAVVEMEVPDV